MRDLSELELFWPSEAGIPDVSEADICQIETQFGINLPAEYKRLLLLSNGGSPRRATCRPKGGRGTDGTAETVVGHFYPLATETEEHTGSVREGLIRLRPVLGHAFVAIASDPGGWEYVLDWKAGPVDICIGEEGFRRVRVADTFAEFIDMLF